MRLRLPLAVLCALLTSRLACCTEINSTVISTVFHSLRNIMWPKFEMQSASLETSHILTCFNLQSKDYEPLQRSLDQQAVRLKSYSNQIAAHQEAVGRELQQATLVDTRNWEIIKSHQAYLASLKNQYDAVKSDALTALQQGMADVHIPPAPPATPMASGAAVFPQIYSGYQTQIYSNSVQAPFPITPPVV
eukprot:jgi/Bigna1/69568/fgenesh1_pg.9_\